MTEISVTRLLTNQFIVGKTSVENEKIVIKDPYTLIPDPMGIQMFPLDEAIIGHKIEEISVSVSNILYSQVAGENIKDAYFKDKTGIEVPEKKLIL